MLFSKRRGPALLALALLLSAAPANAQEPAFHFDVTADGIAVSGSITVDGQTWSAEDIQALATSFLGDSSTVLLNLPPAVSEAVVQLGSAMRSQGAGGGAP